jgi:hypothetical protein
MASETTRLVVVQPRKRLCRAPYSLNKIRTLIFCRGVPALVLSPPAQAFQSKLGLLDLYSKVAFVTPSRFIGPYRLVLTLLNSLIQLLRRQGQDTDSVTSNHGGRQHHLCLPSGQCEYPSSDCWIRDGWHAFPGVQWRQRVDCGSYNLSDARRV